MIIQDDSNSGAAERLAIWAAVAIVAGCLGVSVYQSDKTRSQAAAFQVERTHLQEKLDRSDLMVARLVGDNGRLTTERDALSAEVDLLRATTPRIVYRCDAGHPTPVFSRDKRFIARQRR